MWLATTACLVTGILRWRDTRTRLAIPPVPVRWAAPDPVTLSDSLHYERVLEATALLAERDPFTPPDAAPQAGQVSAGPITVIPERRPVRPALVLKGVVGTAPLWRAIVDGLPGRSGSALVQQGDTIGDLRVRRLTADTLVIQGADTTWRLTVRRQWQ